MKDPIERADAIDVVKRLMGDCELSRTVQTGLHILPSAQPDVPDINDGDMISRKAAIDALESKTYRHTYLDQIVGIIKDLPSARPDYKTDHGYMWICPKCGLVIHSDFDSCVRCGHER